MGLVIDIRTREILADDGSYLLPEDQMRRRNNDYVLNQWLRGMSLSAVPAAATHFPPRKQLAKDDAAIDRLFGRGDE